MKRALWVFLLCLLPALAYGRTIEGTVTKVADGDTIQVTDDLGTRVKVRLYGIDAPETAKGGKPGMHFGDEAEAALKAKVFRRQVSIDIKAIDRYKRAVGLIALDGRDINREMVAEGFAWAYRQYLDRPHASEYIGAEEQARKQRLGLWCDPNPQPPWEFRKFQRRR